MKTLYEMLTDSQTGLEIPCAYSHFTGEDFPEAPPYLVYLGDGQDNFEADNTYYWGQNRYRLEYYFTKKDESLEAQIEQFLLGNGFLYEKSEDVYIQDQDVFVIYYNI